MPALTAFELLCPLSRTYTALSLIALTRVARSIALLWRKRGLLWLDIGLNIGARSRLIARVRSDQHLPEYKDGAVIPASVTHANGCP
jgi:hypothetical protein